MKKQIIANTKFFAFIFVLNLIFFHSLPTLASQSTLGFWSGLFLNARFAKESPYGFYLEIQPRIHEDLNANRANRVLIRPAFTYAVSAQWSLAAGYGWTPNLSPLKNENRFWQQVTFSEKFGAFDFFSRTRLEQRHIQFLEPTAWRARELIKFLGKSDAFLSWTVWDEIFIHLNNASQTNQTGLDQNRLFLGPVLFFQNPNTSRARLEFGYMNVFTYSPDVRIVNHLWIHTVTTYLFIDF